jgi:hypothetical protein
MGLFVNLKSMGRKESDSDKNSVNRKSELLIGIIRDSIETARISPDLEIKKTSLDIAMKQVIELLAMANRYPFIASKKLSSIYTSIREVRNEIKLMESLNIPFDKREVA